MNFAACYRTLLDGKRLHRSIDFACTEAGEHISESTLAISTRSEREGWDQRLILVRDRSLHHNQRFKLRMSLTVLQ
jgi:hypothetical protein